MSVIRIDSDSTHGWQARWPAPGKTNGLTMLCSDSVYGSAEKAHRAAQAAEKLLRLQAQALRRPQLLAELQRLLPRGARRS